MKREITALSLHANVCNFILFCKFIGGKKIEWAKAQLKKLFRDRAVPEPEPELVKDKF